MPNLYIQAQNVPSTSAQIDTGQKLASIILADSAKVQPEIQKVVPQEVQGTELEIPASDHGPTPTNSDGKKGHYLPRGAKPDDNAGSEVAGKIQDESESEILKPDPGSIPTTDDTFHFNSVPPDSAEVQPEMQQLVPQFEVRGTELEIPASDHGPTPTNSDGKKLTSVVTGTKAYYDAGSEVAVQTKDESESEILKPDPGSIPTTDDTFHFSSALNYCIIALYFILLINFLANVGYGIQSGKYIEALLTIYFYCSHSTLAAIYFRRWCLKKSEQAGTNNAEFYKKHLLMPCDCHSVLYQIFLFVLQGGQLMFLLFLRTKARSIIKKQREDPLSSNLDHKEYGDIKSHAMMNTIFKLENQTNFEVTMGFYLCLLEYSGSIGNPGITLDYRFYFNAVCLCVKLVGILVVLYVHYYHTVTVDEEQENRHWFITNIFWNTLRICPIFLLTVSRIMAINIVSYLLPSIFQGYKLFYTLVAIHFVIFLLSKWYDHWENMTDDKLMEKRLQMLSKIWICFMSTEGNTKYLHITKNYIYQSVSQNMIIGLLLGFVFIGLLPNIPSENFRVALILSIIQLLFVIFAFVFECRRKSINICNQFMHICVSGLASAISL